MPKRHPDLDSDPDVTDHTMSKLHSIIGQGGEQKRGNRVRRMLEQKRQPPAWQQMDIEPEEGGKSRLHDEHGLPKVAPVPKKDLPKMPELPNTPVAIKASERGAPSQMATGVPNKGRPSKSAEQDFQDDGFIPPKNNFVNVGQVEQAWYDEKVAGPPQEMIDNNEEVDTESLQGMNPMEDVQDKNTAKLRKKFESRLQKVAQGVLAQLETVVNQEQLETFKANVLGRNGVFAKILLQFGELDPSERRVVGELVNQFIDALKLEFEAKEQELYEDFGDDEEEEFDEEGYDQMMAEEDPPEDPAPRVANVAQMLKPRDIAVLVDGKLIKVFDQATSTLTAELRDLLNKIILGNNIDPERVQVIKRLPVDFGIHIGD
jgi:hypothetical protein